MRDFAPAPRMEHVILTTGLAIIRDTTANFTMRRDTIQHWGRADPIAMRSVELIWRDTIRASIADSKPWRWSPGSTIVMIEQWRPPCRLRLFILHSQLTTSRPLAHSTEKRWAAQRAGARLSGSTSTCSAI